MEKLRLYSVSDGYIEYLQGKYHSVYSNIIDSRTHTRKYLGVVLKIGEYNYYVPLSSPKKSDYQWAGQKMVIKKSIVPIIRIVVRNVRGQKELKGTLRISHMIPVPESELELYDIAQEKDMAYKDAVQSEIIFIRKNSRKIIENAKLLYKQKQEKDGTAAYVKVALDFMRLEDACREFAEQKYKRTGE